MMPIILTFVEVLILVLKVNILSWIIRTIYQLIFALYINCYHQNFVKMKIYISLAQSQINNTRIEIIFLNIEIKSDVCMKIQKLTATYRSQEQKPIKIVLHIPLCVIIYIILIAVFHLCNGEHFALSYFKNLPFQQHRLNPTKLITVTF